MVAGLVEAVRIAPPLAEAELTGRESRPFVPNVARAAGRASRKRADALMRVIRMEAFMWPYLYLFDEADGVVKLWVVVRAGTTTRWRDR
jgi:hypothetical protein